MGLDVYTYHIKHKADIDRREAEYEKRTEDLWDQVVGKDVEYKDAEEAKIEEWRTRKAAIADELDLGEYGAARDDERVAVEQDSPEHPDHLFKIGYFRSSYNGGGINHKLNASLGYDLYKICERTDDDMPYEFRPDWLKVQSNANQAIKELKKWVKETGGKDSIQVRFNPFMAPPKLDEQKALEIYHEETKDRTDDSFKAWENAKGLFYPTEPLKVYGFIVGQEDFLSNAQPVVYAIVDGDWNWVLDAHEIVADTAAHVLEQPDPENYYFAWSS